MRRAYSSLDPGQDRAAIAQHVHGFQKLAFLSPVFARVFLRSIDALESSIEGLPSDKKL